MDTEEEEVTVVMAELTPGWSEQKTGNFYTKYWNTPLKRMKKKLKKAVPEVNNQESLPG